MVFINSDSRRSKFGLTPKPIYQFIPRVTRRRALKFRKNGISHPCSYFDEIYIGF